MAGSSVIEQYLDAMVRVTSRGTYIKCYTKRYIVLHLAWHLSVTPINSVHLHLIIVCTYTY